MRISGFSLQHLGIPHNRPNRDVYSVEDPSLLKILLCLLYRAFYQLCKVDEVFRSVERLSRRLQMLQQSFELLRCSIYHFIRTRSAFNFANLDTTIFFSTIVVSLITITIHSKSVLDDPSTKACVLQVSCCEHSTNSTSKSSKLSATAAGIILFQFVYKRYRKSACLTYLRYRCYKAKQFHRSMGSLLLSEK